MDNQKSQLEEKLYDACKKLCPNFHFLDPEKSKESINGVKNFLIMYKSYGNWDTIELFLAKSNQSKENCVYTIIDGESKSDRHYDWRLAIGYGDVIGLFPIGVMIWWSLKPDESIDDLPPNVHIDGKNLSVMYSIEHPNDKFDMEPWVKYHLSKKTDKSAPTPDNFYLSLEESRSLVIILDCIGINVNLFSAADL